MEALTASLVTGVTVGRRGSVQAVGTFLAHEFCFIGEHIFQRPRLSTSCLSLFPKVLSDSESKYILLVSGLKIGAADSSLLAIQMFIDYVSGRYSSEANSHFIPNICKVIIS